MARVADDVAAPTWERFGREIERMRYRGGTRAGYTSRLHYFSEWIADGEKRGLVRDLGAELGTNRRSASLLDGRGAWRPADGWTLSIPVPTLSETHVAGGLQRRIVKSE